MGRSQRHLREIQGVDSAGQILVNGQIFVPADAAVSFKGPIADLVLVQNVAMDPVDLSVEFKGYDTPFAFTSVGTALPTGLALSGAGVLSGTPTTVAVTAGVQVRATDATDADVANSNLFSITVAAA